jgi:hypothetical protein
VQPNHLFEYLLVQNNGFCKCDHTTTNHCEITTGDICVISSVHTVFKFTTTVKNNITRQTHTTVKCLTNYIHQVFNIFLIYPSCIYLIAITITAVYKISLSLNQLAHFPKLVSQFSKYYDCLPGLYKLYDVGDEYFFLAQ